MFKPDVSMSVGVQNDQNDVKPSAVSSGTAVPDAPVRSYGRPDDAGRSNTGLSIAPDVIHSETIAGSRNIPAASSHTGDLSNDMETSKPPAKSTATTKIEKKNKSPSTLTKAAAKIQPNQRNIITVVGVQNPDKAYTEFSLSDLQLPSYTKKKKKKKKKLT
jgi:hypothetical protein